jgi:hypothetical protein
VDRYRHQQVPACAGYPPAGRHGRCQWPCEPPFACVLELMDGRPRRSRERRTPLQLGERHRHRRWQADGHAGRNRQPGGQRAATSWAQGNSFCPTTGA